MADVIVGLDTEGKVEAACVDAWNPADTPDIMAWIRRGLTVKLVKGPVALGRRLPTPAPESPTVGRRISRAEALQIAKDIGIKAEQERQAQDDPKPPLVGVKPDFPKADKEDVIWRAIGSLTQRVRDLEHPTPAPEPPKPDADQPKAAFVQASENKQPPSDLTLNSKEWANSTIWHDPEVKAEVESEVKAATLRAVGEALLTRENNGPWLHIPIQDIEALRAGKMPEGWGK